MKKLGFVIILLLMTIMANAQFKGDLTVGFSGNQIDGDGLAGFHKLGLTGGFSLYHPIKSKLDVGLEFLYTQRGSTKKTMFAEPDYPFAIHLDYMEVPIFVRYKDWYLQEEDYYKAFVDFGLSTGYLFKVKTTNDFIAIDDFKKIDLSVLAGIGFAFSKRWKVGLRYTRAVIPINYKRGFRDAWIVSYNWNVKVYYNL